MTKFGSNYYIEAGEKKTTKLQTEKEQQQRTAFLTFYGLLCTARFSRNREPNILTLGP